MASQLDPPQQQYDEAKSSQRPADMSFKQAVHLLCSSSHPDDIQDACKALAHKDFAQADPAVVRAMALVVLPRLLYLLDETPKQKHVDAENWAVFWVLRAVSELIPGRLERAAVKRGAIGLLTKHLSMDAPESMCVALKAIALASAGYSAEGVEGGEDDYGATADEFVSAQETLGDFERAVQRLVQIVDSEMKTKRVDRHPFVLPLAAYALAFMLANEPAAVTVDLSRICGIFCELVEEGDFDEAESVLLACDALVRRGGEARKTAMSSKLLGKVLWRVGRGDYAEGDLAELSIGLLETVVEEVPGGAKLLDKHGVRALSKTLSELKTPAEQQKAIKLATALLAAAEDQDEALHRAVQDGLVVETFLCLTEAPDLPTRKAALGLLDHIIRNSSPATYNAMEIDAFFVLSLLALAKWSGTDKELVDFGRQITGLVMWMCRNGRCSMEQVCAVGNYDTASRITNGMGAMMLANTIHTKLKEHKDKEAAAAASRKAAQGKQGEAKGKAADPEPAAPTEAPIDMMTVPPEPSPNAEPESVTTAQQI